MPTASIADTASTSACVKFLVMLGSCAALSVSAMYLRETMSQGAPDQKYCALIWGGGGMCGVRDEVLCVKTASLTSARTAQALARGANGPAAGLAQAPGRGTLRESHSRRQARRPPPRRTSMHCL